MSPKAKKLLYDIRDSAEAIFSSIDGKGFEDYIDDRVLRSSIHWEFATIGEAMNRLQRDFPDIAEQITDRQRIIAFRNQLIHGYDLINAKIVWDVIQHELRALRDQTDARLDEKS